LWPGSKAYRFNLAHDDPRANASKLLLITTRVKNQRKNQDFALDYFLRPKAMPAAGYANA
jgi:hypothetical protein